MAFTLLDHLRTVVGGYAGPRRNVPLFNLVNSATGILLTIFLVGCERGEVTLVAPEGSVSGTNVLELNVTVAAEEGISANTFGWASGVPGAEVTLLRVRDYEPIVRTEGTTGPSGVARFEGLRRGLQWVTAFLWLEGPEAEALPPEWPVAALAGGGKIQVSGATDTTLVLRLPRPGSMVISEVALQAPPQFEYVGDYKPGLYLELFNNGELTAYLDGMLLGKVYQWYHDYSRNGHHACVDSEAMRVDPEGIWTARFWRFPGSGNDHPVEPGETVVIAVSATDHRYVHPTMQDLTSADFEFRPRDIGTADNPAAPDMEDAGPNMFATPLFFANSSSWFLASPTDIASLPLAWDPATSSPAEYVRIPRERLLDVAHQWWDNAEAYHESAWPLCLDPVNPLFDAVPGAFGTAHQSALSAQRRAVRGRDGRVMLLDTDVSALDFLMMPKTPGWVPEAEK